MVSRTIVGIEKVTMDGRFWRMVSSNCELLDGPIELAIQLSSIGEGDAPSVEEAAGSVSQSILPWTTEANMQI